VLNPFAEPRPFPGQDPWVINVDGSLLSTNLVGNGVAFLRFSVPNGQDALLTTTSGGQTLPSSVKLSVVRIR